jgi:hypothetical protein
MNVLGLRFSNKAFSYAIVSGSKGEPTLIESDTLSLPKAYSKVQSLYWVHQEIKTLIERFKISKVVMKGFEGLTRNRSFEERIENEAIVYIASHSSGLDAVFKKVSSTIAKDLGLKGRKHYLATAPNTSSIPEFENLDENQKEAVYAGVSELI